MLGRLTRDFRVRMAGVVKETIQGLANARGLQLRIKEMAVDPEASRPEWWTEDPDYQLLPYQRKGVSFLHMAKCALLADDCGLGKTAQTIGTILWAFDDNEIDRAVIAVPKSVTHQWRDEFDLFMSREYFPDLNIQVIKGDRKWRRRQYDEPGDVIIMSHDVYRRDAGYLAQLSWWDEPRTAAVLDEANVIKNRETKIAQRVKRYLSRAAYRMALTATPVENGLHDLYSIFEWVDRTVFPSRAWFEAEYCNMTEFPLRRGYGYVMIRKVESYKNLGDAERRIAHAYLRRTTDEVGLELPDVRTNVLCLEFTEPHRKMYAEQVEKVAALRDAVRNAADEEYVREVRGALGKLLRICDSPGLYKGGKHADSAKLDEILRMARELPPGEKVIFFSEYAEMVHAIADKLQHYRPLVLTGDTPDTERQQIRRVFMETDTRFLIMSSAGERGMNLQRAGLLVNVDLPYNPAKLKQRIGRIYRIGNPHDVIRIINLVMEDSYESKVLEVLNEKVKLFDAIFKPDGIELIGDPVGAMTANQLAMLAVA